MTETKEKGSTNAVFIGLSISTLVYVTALAWLLTKTKSCATAVSFIDRMIGCRTINELGDFLAGAFAPLAFAWLAGAVVIQGRELRAQREELAASRAEAVLAREIAAEQNEETKASVELLRVRIEIEKKSLKLLEEQEFDDEFDQIVFRLNRRLSMLGGGIYKLENDPSIQRIPKVSDESDADVIASIRMIFQWLEKYGNQLVINKHQIDVLSGIYHECGQAIAQVSKLSAPHRQRAKTLRLQYLYWKSMNVLERIKPDVVKQNPEIHAEARSVISEGLTTLESGS